MATATAPVKDVLTTDDEQISAGFAPNRVIGCAIFSDSHVHAISAEFLTGHKAFKAARNARGIGAANLNPVPLGAPADAEIRIPHPAPLPKATLDGDAWSGLWYPNVDAIGVDYVMSPILLERAKPVERQTWRSGRLSKEQKMEMLLSPETQSAIFGTAWQSVERLYSKGFKVADEQKQIAELVRSDVTKELYRIFCSTDGRRFSMGRRERGTRQWRGSSRPVVVNVQGSPVTVPRGKLAGLIRLAKLYTYKVARRTKSDHEWTQYRPVEMVANPVLLKAPNAIPDDAEVGPLRLLCAQCKTIEPAEKVGLLGDYKLRCGHTRIG